MFVRIEAEVPFTLHGRSGKSTRASLRRISSLAMELWKLKVQNIHSLDRLFVPRASLYGYIHGNNSTRHRDSWKPKQPETNGCSNMANEILYIRSASINIHLFLIGTCFRCSSPMFCIGNSWVDPEASRCHIATLRRHVSVEQCPINILQ